MVPCTASTTPAPNEKPSVLDASFAAIASCDAAADAPSASGRADKIRRLSLTAAALATFLKRVLTSSLRAACRAAGGYLCDRTWQRLWKRFDLGQCRIRTALLGLCPPPEGAAAATRPLAAQILAHLHDAFPHADCPIAAFQMTLNTFFL